MVKNEVRVARYVENDWINEIEELQCPDPANTVIFRIPAKNLTKKIKTIMTEGLMVT